MLHDNCIADSMSPLSDLSPAGMNVRSPLSVTSHPLTPRRPLQDRMIESQENQGLHYPLLEENGTEHGMTRTSDSAGMSPSKLALPPSPRLKATIERLHIEQPLSERPKNEQDIESIDTSATGSHGFDPDNTCFSTFSAIPNAGMAAIMGRDVNVLHQNNLPGSHSSAMSRRGAYSPSKTPSRSPVRARDNTTPQLLEFTEEMDLPTYSSSRQASPMRSRGQELMAGASHRMRSPGGRAMNLLDFDLPPAPTPRSIPSISTRELESLKAGFLSEISSLKAKLSGTQAEIHSLKEAKNDAERRVGTLSEELRDTKNAMTVLEQEKSDWEKHDTERRETLAKSKEEYIMHEEEINRLRKLLEEQNKELHLEYAAKHKQKVASLKKSYEKQWKSQVDELTSKVEELKTNNMELRAGRDVPPVMETESASDNKRNSQKSDEADAQIRLLTEEKAGLKQEVEEAYKQIETMGKGVTLLERDNVTLKTELQESRKQNSDLVTVVDEMLAIDLATSAVSKTSRPSSREKVTNAPESGNPGVRTAANTSKLSGPRGPGFGTYGESKIGTGLRRNPSGSGTSSRIMSNIERMGRGIGGRGGQE